MAANLACDPDCLGGRLAGGSGSVALRVGHVLRAAQASKVAGGDAKAGSKGEGGKPAHAAAGDAKGGGKRAREQAEVSCPRGMSSLTCHL